MPWKECSVMDERLQFVARRLEGEAMADLCREFGISRKTGYKTAAATNIGNTCAAFQLGLNNGHRWYPLLQQEIIEPTGGKTLQSVPHSGGVVHLANTATFAGIIS